MNFYTAMKMNKLLLIYQNIPKLPECEIKQKKPDTKESYCIIPLIVVVQSQSHTWLFAAPWAVAHQSPLSSTISQSVLRFIFLESVMLSNYLILCHLLLLLPSIFPSIKVFSSKLTLCIRWPKYWSFSFSISPSNGYSGFISFRIDWFDFLAVQGLSKVFSIHAGRSSIISYRYIEHWVPARQQARHQEHSEKENRHNASPHALFTLVKKAYIIQITNKLYV